MEFIKLINKILKKAERCQGITAEEAYELLLCKDNFTQQHVLSLAAEIKNEIYGRRVVLFSPLYVSNFCQNSCKYCGFSKKNRIIKRKRLTKTELQKEVGYLLQQGVKRLLIVSGEENDIDYITELISYVYSIDYTIGKIKRINVNIAPLSVEGFKRLKSANIGTYQIFQETYNRERYDFFHPSGPKSDFDYRYHAPFRAVEAGIKDMGMGVLFGLHDYKEDVYGLLKHIEELKKTFNIGPHTISVPRLKKVSDMPFDFPIYPISDDDFAYIIAVLRLAVPYTGIILSTRESANLRDRLCKLGVSQISAASATSPGGYTSKDTSSQFSISDERSMYEVVLSLMEQQLIPSFCTACYRSGRVGEDFMELAESGQIKNYCNVNALLSLAEYVRDFFPNDKRQWAKEFIYNSAMKMGLKNSFQKKIDDVFLGRSDIYV